MTNAAKLILQSSLGSELSQEEADALGNIMTARELADGEFLINEGVADDALHVLLDGKLESVRKAPPFSLPVTLGRYPDRHRNKPSTKCFLP